MDVTSWLQRRRRAVVGAGFFAALTAVAFVARRAGLDRSVIEAQLLAVGCFAGPLFVLLFTAGELVHLPGVLFVVTARVVFGPVHGALLAYVGAVVAVTASFALARRFVRGREPFRPRWAPLARLFARVEARPVLTIALLRLFMMASPPLNYALAATNVRGRDHLLGSALGLAVPVSLVAWSAGLF